MPVMTGEQMFRQMQVAQEWLAAELKRIEAIGFTYNAELNRWEREDPETGLFQTVEF